MGCAPCQAAKKLADEMAAQRAATQPKVMFEAYGGPLTEPQRFDTFQDAKNLSNQTGARLRSVRVAPEPQPA